MRSAILIEVRCGAVFQHRNRRATCGVWAGYLAGRQLGARSIRENFGTACKFVLAFEARTAQRLGSRPADTASHNGCRATGLTIASRQSSGVVSSLLMIRSKSLVPFTAHMGEQMRCHRKRCRPAQTKWLTNRANWPGVSKMEVCSSLKQCV